MTKIDEFHAWTHTREIEEVIQNETIRHMMRKVADLAQGLKNCNSNYMAKIGIMYFDEDKLTKRIEELLAVVKNSVVKE